MYNKENENVVLCASNSYEKKYYFNPDFDKLPEDIKNELKIMCVFLNLQQMRETFYMMR